MVDDDLPDLRAGGGRHQNALSLLASESVPIVADRLAGRDQPHTRHDRTTRGVRYQIAAGNDDGECGLLRVIAHVRQWGFHVTQAEAGPELARLDVQAGLLGDPVEVYVTYL